MPIKNFGMGQVQTFDDVDEMFAAISRGVEAAKKRATAKQNAISYGDYWLRAYDDILIFGHITPEDELWAAELELGASEEEIEAERAMMAASYDDGFRFGRAYSIICPEGELGDTHVCDMIPITKEEFEESKDLYWIPEAIRQLPWFNRSLLDRI
jgi:hypothetical protein